MSSTRIDRAGSGAAQPRANRGQLPRGRRGTAALSNEPLLALALILGVTIGCGESPAKPDGGGGPGPTTEGGTDSGAPPAFEPEVTVEVPQSGRVHVSLDHQQVISAEQVGAEPTGWDLAFEGDNVLTNSGPSGPGLGGGFGPLEREVFDQATDPTVPFLQGDEPGGTFTDWYAYDGRNHVIFSRYHVYGVRDPASDRLWKVQILGYYGEQLGAPVSALYRVRYAEVTGDGTGPTREIEDLDATAGGTGAPPEAPSGCLDLSSGEVRPLLPDQAVTDAGWHLCFRRSAISLNGGQGGPAGLEAVDLDRTAEEEPLEEVTAWTAESELPRFEARDRHDLTASDLRYRGDGIHSTFTSSWLPPGSSAPDPGTWLVIGADGARRFLVRFWAVDLEAGRPTRVQLGIRAITPVAPVP